MNADVCAKCGCERSLFVAEGRCDRGDFRDDEQGRHRWRPFEVLELAVDCVTCRRRLVIHGQPFVESESETGRVRRAFLADPQRVIRWMTKHSRHELATSPVENEPYKAALEMARRKGTGT